MTQVRTPRIFVLVHGGFHGGWCWADVATRLRARGHTVYTPTQTGCGERSHLMSADITLDTFVTDIANVLHWEDLHEVVLVGHSFGSNAISGVADRMPGRLRQLIYLDGVILHNGQTMFDGLSPEAVQVRRAAALTGDGLSVEAPTAASFGIRDTVQAAFVQARLTRQPLSTYTSALTLAHPVTNGVPSVYIECTDPPLASIQSTRDWVKASGMQTVQMRTGHDAMISAPAQLVELLEGLSGA